MTVSCGEVGGGGLSGRGKGRIILKNDIVNEGEWKRFEMSSVETRGKGNERGGLRCVLRGKGKKGVGRSEEGSGSGCG